MQEGKKGFAIAALVLGIVSCIIAWWTVIGAIIGIACAIAGLIFAILAKKSYNAINQKNGMATAGMVLSIIGIVFSILSLIIFVLIIGAVGSVAQQLESQGWTLSTEAIDTFTNSIM